MNRFLNKKRAKESPTAETFPQDPRIRPITPTLTKKGRKWRKNQPEPKVELDLSTALPSDDNFRTSLLMNGLSARFSMLREQDDPNSKLGKASDDSVLQPKRQSRLHDFGFVSSSLADIAEVSSINEPIRPPFAMRQNSFASGDGYGTDDESTHGSIMSRSRPGEGNVLFGGRQKVYKIPMASSSGLKSSRTRGKAVYEDDISQSAFQKMRQREKEVQQEEDLRRASEDAEPAEMDGEKDTSYPGSIAGSSYLKRQTSSSTTSQPSITGSTAATSIASQGATAVSASGTSKANQPGQGLERSTTKSRRLYDQGLNEHLYEQQTSALTRLNSIQKHRNVMPGRQTPPYLSQTQSTSNLHDRFNRLGSHAFQATSPPPSASAYKLTTFDFLRESKSSTDSPLMSYPNSPPLSPPPMSDSEDTPLAMSLNPGDRGKATAMGAFNKPKQQFDEEQYLERQRQMLQGLEMRFSRQGSPTIYEEEQAQPTTIDQESVWSHSSLEKDRQDMRRQSSMNSSISRQNDAERLEDRHDITYETQKTFFAEIGSDSEDEPPVSPLEAIYSPQQVYEPLRVPAPISPVEQHPAFRSTDQSGKESSEHIDFQPSSLQNAINIPKIDEEEPASTENENAALKELDSPTLGAEEGALSGLIRQHLRQESGQSSVWGDRTPAPVVPPLDAMPSIPRSRMASRDRTESSYPHSNPWDLDDIDNTCFGEGDSLSSVSPIEGGRLKNQPFGSAISKASEQRSLASQKDADNVPWQQVLRNKHSRGGSTETQEEREAFANELAQRQKAIQENMKAKAEGGSRDASPSPGSERLRVFGMLRSKSSRESIVSKAEPSAKALKRLGISINDSSTASLLRNNTQRSQASGFDEQDDASVRGRRLPPINTQKSVEDMRRKWEAHLQCENERNRAEVPNRATTYSQSSYGPSIRDRSNSELSSGRSRSQSGRHRDEDLRGPSFETVPEASPSIPQRFQFPMDLKQTQTAALENPTPPSSARLPTINKAKSAYFDTQGLKPVQSARSGDRSGPSSGANSPMLPSPSLFRPQQHSASLPHSPPNSASNTPPTSALPTPSYMPVGPPPPQMQAPNRKRSVQKSDISEPTLISSTSNFDTVDLPPGASLKNGREPSSAPPVPPMNPLRRRTQKLFGNALGRSDSAPEVPTFPVPTSMQNSFRTSPERSNSSPDEDERSWSRQRNRNTAGNRSAKTRGPVSPLSPPSPSHSFKPRVAPANMQAVAHEGGMF